LAAGTGRPATQAPSPPAPAAPSASVASEAGRAAAELRLAVAHRPGLALAAAVSLGGGVVLASLGSAWGALPIVAGFLLLALVDRRIGLLAVLVALPSLTVFHPLPALEIGGSVLDFRLLLTAGLAAALGLLVIVDRVPVDGIGRLLLAVVVFSAAWVVLNEAPLRGLPTVGRLAVYAAAYLLARRWLAAPALRPLVVLAVMVAVLPPAVVATVEGLTGAGERSDEAIRLTGVYLTSPVGLALAMQLGGLAAIALRKLAPLSPRQRAVLIALAVVFGSVLVFTSTRLVFASFFAGLLLFELLTRSPRSVPVIVLAAVVALAVQPDLANRLTNTGQTNTPGADGAGQDLDGADDSFRTRLFLWQTMAGEWLESPIVGHGTGAFALRYEAITGAPRVAPHNDYLGFLVDGGVIGLGLYLLLQAAVIFSLARTIRAGGPAGSGAILAVLALTVFLATNVGNAINNAILYVDLQVVVWVLVAAGVRATSHGTTHAPAPARATR
jgi:O-antigen ligase